MKASKYIHVCRSYLSSRFGVDREDYGSTRWKWAIIGVLASFLPFTALGYLFGSYARPEPKRFTPDRLYNEIVCPKTEKVIEYVPVNVCKKEECGTKSNPC